MAPTINVKIDGTAEGLNKAFDEAGEGVSKFGGLINGIKLGGQIAAVAAVVTGLAKVTMDTVRMGQDSIAAQAKFEKAIENAGAATDGYQAKVDDAIKAGAKLAFTDDEIRDALVTLTTQSHDVNNSLSTLTAAQDLARGTGVDLATASDAIAKALAGNDRQLAALLPGITKGESAMATLGQAFAATSGQANIFAQSGEAAGVRTAIGFSELQETIGEKLVPAFDKMGKALQPIIEKLIELLVEILPKLVPVIDTVADVFVVLADAVVKAFDLINDLWRQVEKLLGPLQDLLGKLSALNPFGNLIDQITGIFNRSVPGGGTPTGPSINPQAGNGAIPTHNGGVTINIYGDPSVIEARVTKALRDYSRRNGVGAVFTPGRN